MRTRRRLLAATINFTNQASLPNQATTGSSGDGGLAPPGAEIYPSAMPDELNNLRTTLAELHRQLEAARNLDADSRAMLRQVMADIDQALARGDEDRQTPPAEGLPPSRGSLGRRLADAAGGFESTHPMLSGAIGSVVDALAQMGI